MTKKIDDMTGPELVSEYNAMADDLGVKRVNRFASRGDAVRRVRALLSDWARDTGVPSTTTLPQVSEVLKVEKAAALEVVNPTAPSPSEPPTPAVRPAKLPRWRAPKRREPSRIAYRPRKGTQQAAAYPLLTRPATAENPFGGIDIVEFCDLMTPLNGPTTKPWDPQTTWSVLGYLWVSQKGYGLEFNGTYIRLIVPTDERDAGKGE